MEAANFPGKARESSWMKNRRSSSVFFPIEIAAQVINGVIDQTNHMIRLLNDVHLVTKNHTAGELQPRMPTYPIQRHPQKTTKAGVFLFGQGVRLTQGRREFTVTLKRSTMPIYVDVFFFRQS